MFLISAFVQIRVNKTVILGSVCRKNALFMVVKVVTGKVKKCLCLKFLKMTLYSSNGKKLLNEADMKRRFPGMIIFAQNIS